jgi:hypothetical protein
MDFSLPEILPLKNFTFVIGVNSLEKVLSVLIKNQLLDDTYEWLIKDSNVVCLANDIYPFLTQKVLHKDNFKIRMYDLLYKRGLKVNVTLTCVTPAKIEASLQTTSFIEHSFTNPFNYSDYLQFKKNKNDGSMWNIQPSKLPFDFVKEYAVSIGSWIFINKGFFPYLQNTFGTEEKVINRWLLSLYNNDNSEKMAETDSIFFYRLGSAFLPNLKLRTNDNVNIIDHNLLLHDGGGWIIGHTPKIEKKTIENSSFILEKSVIHVNYQPFKPLENQTEFNVFSILNNDTHTILN